MTPKQLEIVRHLRTFEDHGCMEAAAMIESQARALDVVTRDLETAESDLAKAQRTIDDLETQLRR